MIRASIVGASGYGGGELARLLSGHPEVRIVAATAMQQQGRRVDESFPSLRSFNDLTMEAPDWKALARQSDVVFLALPHGVSQEGAPELLDGGTRVIDIAADFRLRDLESHQQWYGAHQAPQLLAQAVYGLPELHADEIAGAKLVACPGCYPTASILAVMPALDWREPGAPIIVDAKSGVSGAGRNAGPNNLFSEVNENVRPYNLGRHRTPRRCCRRSPRSARASRCGSRRTWCR
jgi:N-acetyl-gamma-glutamyl-phosphate reductase